MLIDETFEITDVKNNQITDRDGIKVTLNKSSYRMHREYSSLGDKYMILMPYKEGQFNNIGKLTFGLNETEKTYNRFDVTKELYYHIIANSNK